MSDIRKMIEMKCGIRKTDADEVKDLVELADEYYEMLYSNHRLDDALVNLTNKAYEEFVVSDEKLLDIVKEMVKYRGDFYSSDREIASVMLAFSYRGYIW